MLIVIKCYEKISDQKTSIYDLCFYDGNIDYCKIEEKQTRKSVIRTLRFNLKEYPKDTFLLTNQFDYLFTYITERFQDNSTVRVFVKSCDTGNHAIYQIEEEQKTIISLREIKKAQLESAAVGRGCQYSLLDTLNFQAAPFYQKFRYEKKWVQENYPKTGCKYFMVKHLLPA